MINGWARMFAYHGSRFDRYDTYTESEDSARAEPAGVWAACSGNFHAPSPV